MAMTDIKIQQADINDVAISIAVAGDKLSGTVLQNKQVFDAYPDMIVTHFNDLCDYVDSQTPEGDCGLEYTPTEVAFICGVLGCTESSITL